MVVTAIVITVLLAQPESFFSDLLAQELHGRREVVLIDRSRVDIVTPAEAIEVDWARKWAEGIGQSMYYAAMTDRRPVVILLVAERNREAVYILRARVACARAGVDVWWYDIVPGELHR